jgi:hypothetical protein
MWSDERWGPLLGRWERALQVEESRTRRPGDEPTPFRRAGADVAAIEALEHRIGRRLPPSYRTFLLATDGFRADGWGAAQPFDSAHYNGLLPASRVMTLAWADPVTVLSHAVPDTPFGPGPFEPEDVVAFLSLAEETRYELPPVGHLLHAIAVSGPQQHGNIVLDPLIVDAADEWEAWRWDADGCTRFASFGSLVQYVVAEAEQAADAGQPAPSGVQPDAQEALTRLESTADEDPVLVEDLRRRCLDGPASERAPWIRELGAALGARAAALTISLLREHPDDVPLVGNLAQTSGAWFGSADAREPVVAALQGAHGDALASSIVHRWPEPIEQVYAATGDPDLLRHLLFARRPGSLIAAVEALARPDLDPEVCRWLSYTLSHAAADHPDVLAVDTIAALADRPGVSRFHLVQALISISPDAVVSMLERALTEGSNADGALGTVDYTFWALASQHLAAAAPALVRYLDAGTVAEHAPLTLRTLACLDHPETVPTLVSALNGGLRDHALLALEQVAVSAEMGCAEDARVALADEVSDHEAEPDVLRALARTRHPSAVDPLARLRAREKRAAIEGLADVESAAAVGALDEASRDSDEAIAAIAIHGLLRARAAGVELRAESLTSAIDALGRRHHPSAPALAARWLASAGG